MAPLSISRRREAVAFYLTISPWLIGLVLFTAGPMLISLYVSFTDWDLLTTPTWIGLDNYARLFDDPRLWQAFKVTATYTAAYVPLELVGGLTLALLARPRLRGSGVFRTILSMKSTVHEITVDFTGYCPQDRQDPIFYCLLDFKSSGLI